MKKYMKSILARGTALLLVLALSVTMLPATMAADTSADELQSMSQEPAAEPLAGKVISILGDSISTFAGYIPTADGFNLEHLARYPQDNLLTDVNETWWMQVIAQLDAKLGINDSWRGATVSGAVPVTTGTTGENAAMGNLTRIQNLGSNGTPDVILFYGGTNDLAHVSNVGTFDSETAPVSADLTTPKWDNLADGYVHTLLRLQHYYPDAMIVAMLPTVTTSYYSDEKLAQGNQVLAAICEHYGVTCVDLRNCGITTSDLPDGIHPDATGMDYISAAVLEALRVNCEMAAGENTVYSVTHDLTGVDASRGYYKGISAGKTFTETLTADSEMAVAVTMGGTDITDSCYANGTITIGAVAGDLVITARSKFSLGERLQQLPAGVCASTNLWAVLEPENDYYTGTSWGNIASGEVYSVTVPISPGDRLWATSFQEKGTNGGSRNAIRTTWFGEDGVLKSVSPDDVYTEFTANGYLTAPEGANAVNVVMWKASENNEFYILSLPHDYSSTITPPTCTEEGYTTYTCKFCTNSYKADPTNKISHSYNEDVCTVCGAARPSLSDQILSMYYDDHLDLTDKTVEIVDAGTPTSYQVGYGVEENAVPDTAVVTLEGDTLVATGIGTAKVRIDGQLYEITVTAAPISLLLLAGQSNMQGIDGDPNQSVICPDGQVYATYADRYKKTVEDVTKFAPSSLAGAYSTINVTGDTVCLESYPVNMLTAVGNGREGMDSGLAYEWVKQTGEKVWVINLGYGGSSINGWLEGGEHYRACTALFSACQETLRQEIAAGHYTLSHMGYFWCQGCADETQTAQWYVEKFQAMHQLFQEELTFDHDSDAITAEKSMEFAAIIPIRAGHSWMSSYRAGIYTDTTDVPYYQSFQDLRFNGPRVAQYWMGNNPELADIWNVCTIQEGWATMPDGSDGVTEYFRSAYENGAVDYPVQVQQSASWYTPTTPAAVHDNIHYNQIGYNEVGRESARNTLIYLGEVEAPETDAVVKFVGWDGFTEVTDLTASTVGVSGTLVVPMVCPVYKSKEVTYDFTTGLSYHYYDLLAEGIQTIGTLTAQGAVGSVAVSSRTLATYTWTFDGSELASDPSPGDTDNPLTHLAGSISNAQFSGIRYQVAQSVLLLHDQAWCLEIQISNWTASTGSMLLSSGPNASDGQPYLYFRPTDYFVGFGYYDGIRYHNHGISLKKYDIACNEGTHIYRFVNQIAEDGSNMVWLYVDDQQIAPLTDHYINSTLSDSDNHWISGVDFVMLYIGTSNMPVTGCVVNSIRAVETGFDLDTHIHRWTDWQTFTTPSPDGPGSDQRTCTDCGETQNREVEGVWQKWNLSDHLAELPDSVCCDTNLWAALEHDEEYFANGINWGVHSTGKVYSVTIPVSAGDQIYASAFGAAGTNGSSSNGIRCTFFDAYGVAKTMAPAETYAEFSTNGYLTAPEGAVAVNVPMWTNSDQWEMYILNLPHSFGDWEVVTDPAYTQTGLEQRVCTYGCGTVETQVIPATGPELIKAVSIVHDDQTNTVNLTNVPEGLTVVLAIYEDGQMVYAALDCDEGETASFVLLSGWSGTTATVFFLTADWQPIGPNRMVSLSS